MNKKKKKMNKIIKNRTINLNKNNKGKIKIYFLYDKNINFKIFID